MKSSFLGDFLFILILTTFWRPYDCHSCGKAGSFTTTGNQQIVLKGHSVYYHCFNQGVLFGNHKRDCQPNGVYEGTIPFCVIPTYKFIRAVNQSSSHGNERKDINASICLNDLLIKDPCIHLSSEDKNKRVTIDFDRPYNIVAVRLIISPNNFYRSIVVYAFENSAYPEDSEGVRCVYNERELGVYKCLRRINALSVRIRSNSTLPSFMGVNEVYIYEEPGETENCPTPDTPAFGIISGESSSQVARYKCFENYTLIGSNRSFCLANGTWSEPAPICQSLNEFVQGQKNDLCEPIKSINGKWVPEESHDGVQRTTLICYNGFQLIGSPSTVECLSKLLDWSQTNATCVNPGRNWTTSATQRHRESMGTSAPPNQQQPTAPPKGHTKLLIVGIVSGVISSFLVVPILLTVMFARKRCIRAVNQRNDVRRDSSYYHYYNGINYEDMLSDASSNSCSTSRHPSERAPAKDPRVPDILELVYENPSLYNQGNSRNGSTVDADANEPSGHIYSEVGEDGGLVYDEPERVSTPNRGSESSDVFLENEIYGDDEV